MSTAKLDVLAQIDRWGDLLENSTKEVFTMMLGYEVSALGWPREACVPEITAVVGFAGPLSGAMTVRCTSRAAHHIAAAMLGIPVNEVDQQHFDAVGEICNMVAGSFKSKLPGVGDRCMLSVPTIVNGTDYTVHSLVNGSMVHRGFGFQGEVIFLCVEMHEGTEA